MPVMHRLLHRFVPVLAALTLAACGSQPSAAVPDEDDSLLAVQPEVVISADPSNNEPGDAYLILGRPAMSRNTLHVTVQYGGGCARHVLRLYASHVFMESHPVQSPIAIRHNANGDMCRAALTRELRFDLTALRDAWRRSYQQEHGTIILRLRGYSKGTTYDF